MTQPRDQKRKLIEVGLPLLEINDACKAYKERKTGTIRNIHKWFASMPLPAWRALLFAALVDDPEDDERRLYYLDVIRRLVKNGADLPDPEDLREAQLILQAQFPEGVPAVMDPFCGGGSTLVEGQRLGLPTYGSDLNPVPVLISRTLTSILPQVWDQQPLHPESVDVSRRRTQKVSRSAGDGLFPDSTTPRVYLGYEGLARDVTVYAARVTAAVAEAVCVHFPPTPGETPIAWLWARTARCPNPACRAETILTTSWWLSRKKGALAWVVPEVSGTSISLKVITDQREGQAPAEPKAGRGDFACICCGSTLKAEYLRAEGKRGRLGFRMTAVVAEQGGRRIYRAPHAREVEAARQCPRPVEVGEDAVINPKGAGIRTPGYGLLSWADQYMPRQLTVLAAFADEIAATHELLLKEGASQQWADAVTSLLALNLGKLAQANSCQTRWLLRPTAEAKAVLAFDRNDLPMMWDFAETNPFARSVGSFEIIVIGQLRGLTSLVPGVGRVERQDARVTRTDAALLATDPPYFDAIGYADLSDYFYVWHRRALQGVFPDLYTSMAAPKV